MVDPKKVSAGVAMASRPGTSLRLPRMEFMFCTFSTWRRRCARLLCGLAASSLLSLTGQAQAEPQVTHQPTVIAETPAVKKCLTLAECRAIALERQPAVQAARASLAAAVARAEALEHLHAVPLLGRELCIRRQQAALGVTIAEAGVRQAENDAIYSVTYTYLAYLYAGEQIEVADDALDNLAKMRKRLVDVRSKQKRSDLKPFPKTEFSPPVEEQRIDLYQLVATGRREDAVEGAARALAALREAIGLEDACPVCPVNRRLLAVFVTVDCKEIQSLALARRPEMIQAANLAQVTDFEVCAQATRWCHPRVPTFASGSDLHARPLPAGSFDDVYRPGAIGPEMPTVLAGKRPDRMEQARIYAGRAGSVVDKTRNLITLEADVAYRRFDQADKKLASIKPAAEKARRIFEEQTKRFANEEVGGTSQRFDEWLNGGVLASQLRLELNRTRFQRLVGLAQLEHATSGGFCPGLEAAPEEAKSKAESNQSNSQ
jgi:outer membrane protein TolC